MAFRSNLLQKRIHAITSVLETRSFRLFSIGNFMSLTAIWVVRIASAWVIWELTHSKTWLGMLAFAELGPSLIVSLYSGPLADRRDKFSILRMGQWLQVVLAIILGLIWIYDLGSAPIMVLGMIGYSIIGGFTLPARMAIAPSLVEKHQLATASALGSVTLNVTRLLGPLIAAPFIVANSEGWAFALAALGFLANAICLGRIGSERSAAAPVVVKPGQGGYGAMLRFLSQDRRIAMLLTLQFVLWLLLRPLMDMLPAFADLAFQAGEAGFGTLAAGLGFGAVFGAVYVMGGEETEGLSRQVLGGAIAAAVAMVFFAHTQTLVIGIVIIGLYGAAVTVSGVAATTFVQMNSPKEQLGRIMSLYSLIFRFAPAVGALIFGYTSDRIGLAPVTVACASISLVVVAAYWNWTRTLENAARQ